ncbi:MAG: DUF1775 domain-containing protein [Gaiellaceae bacterium]
MNHRIALGALVALAALATAATASAHALVSPAVALDQKLQQFTLSVPTEKQSVTTSEVVLTVPAGFAIDSFEPSPGWKRTAHGSTITWTGGHVPTDEDAVFRFDASTSSAKTYTFDVRQTYSDGSVVEWSGPESSDAPAPSIVAVSSFGSGTPTLAIVALVLAGVALILSLTALLARSGRPLT